MPTPVVLEYKPVCSTERAERLGLRPDHWQLMAFERSEPDEKGAVYKKLVDVVQHHSIGFLQRLAKKKYEGRVVADLDLSPLVPPLF